MLFLELRGNTNAATDTLSVLLADDQVLFTEAFQNVSGDFGIALTAVSSVAELLSHLSNVERCYDLVIVDLSLPVDEALEILDSLKAQHPETKVALMTSDTRPEVISDAIRRHGAIGVVARTSGLKSLTTAVRFMVDGEQFVPASSLEKFDQDFLDPFDLSADEREIVKEIAIGKTNSQIACSLGLPEEAVKGKTKIIYRKLGVQNRTKAAIIARSRGII